MEVTRHDAVLAAIPVLAASGPTIETLARVAGNPGVPEPIAVAPLTLVGLLATCALIGHELFVRPVGEYGDD